MYSKISVALALGFVALSSACVAGESAAEMPKDVEAKVDAWVKDLVPPDEPKRFAARDNLLKAAVTYGPAVAAKVKPLLTNKDGNVVALAKRVNQCANDPIVKLQTAKGEIVIELFEDAAPNTVANFVQLVEKKYYDGLIFHRCIPDFMIQGGCPKGLGNGGPGYTFPDECANNPNKVVYGALCMANSGPNTNGSQFFIVTKQEGCEWLDGKHTVFGCVLQGMEAVHGIEKCEKAKGSTPKEPQKIEKAAVLRKRDHAYEVKDTAQKP